MIRTRTSALMKRPEIKALVNAIYADRKDRTVNPEGEFDSAGRWYPDATEKGVNSFTGITGPSRAWPYSYMLRARTKTHCHLLVQGWLDGRKTLRTLPSDVVYRIKKHAKVLGKALVAVVGKKAMAKYLRQQMLEAAGVTA